MRFQSESEAVAFIFRSLRKLRGVERYPDEQWRDPTPTRKLLMATGLDRLECEYVVVTGSKGKGSTAAITAKLLEYLGHRVGLLSSPHLVSWTERIRINGRAIPMVDFLRITSELAPYIERIEQTLNDKQYFSPTGILLAIALQWFTEQQVNAAVLEVGRGGRFDDVSVVSNTLSLFTPIMLEHTKYLGPTLDRIAWHKAGIIKPFGYAYSVPQPAEVLNVLRAEADAKNATFEWLTDRDMGQFIRETSQGIVMELGRYGEIELPLHGRYQVMNASLAVQGAGNVHGRLGGIKHNTPQYVQCIRAGLQNVRWPGRLHKVQDQPQVYLDAAINAESARLLIKSLDGRIRQPIISIIGVPDDKDYEGVYRELGAISSQIILTETVRNPILSWPKPQEAQALAQKYCAKVSYQPTLESALEEALPRVGAGGTLLIVGTISLIADATSIWELNFEEI